MKIKPQGKGRILGGALLCAGLLLLAGTASAAIALNVNGAMYPDLGAALAVANGDTGNEYVITINSGGGGSGDNEPISDNTTVINASGVAIANVASNAGKITNTFGGSVLINGGNTGTIDMGGMATLTLGGSNGGTIRGMAGSTGGIQVNGGNTGTIENLGTGNVTLGVMNSGTVTATAPGSVQTNDNVFTNSGTINGNFNPSVPNMVLTLSGGRINGQIGGNQPMVRVTGNATVSGVSATGSTVDIVSGGTLTLTVLTTAHINVQTGGTLDVTGASVPTVTAMTGSTVTGLYSLSFDTNGGQPSPLPPLHTGTGIGVGSTLNFTLPDASAVTLDGYVLTAWEVGGVHYPPGGTVAVTSYLTATAQWGVAPAQLAKVTAAGADGSASIDHSSRTATVTVPAGTDLQSLAVTAAARAGQSVQEGAAFTVDASGGTFTVTVLDINGANPVTYTITVKVGSGQGEGLSDIFVPTGPVMEEATSGAYVVNVSEWVNVRSGPGMDYDIIGKAYLGEALEVIQAQDGWVECYYNNGSARGWIHGDYVAYR